MENLPNDINDIVYSYLNICRKDMKYVFNRESKKVFLKATCNCTRIYLLGTTLCNYCEKKKILRLRMFINNLLPR